MESTWQTRLNNALNKPYTYKNEPIVILSWEQIANNKVLILTNQDDFTRVTTEVDVFLNQCGVPQVTSTEVVKGEDAAQLTITAPALKMAGASAMQQMGDALLDSMQKLQKNPGYLKQAEGIAKLVQTGINLARTELDAHRLLQGGGKRG